MEAISKVGSSNYWRWIKPQIKRSISIVVGARCDGASNITDTNANSAIIYLDPRNLPLEWTLIGGKHRGVRAPLDATLAHELGHVAGVPDPADPHLPIKTGSEIVNLYENRYRKEAGEPMRSRYFTNGLPKM